MSPPGLPHLPLNDESPGGVDFHAFEARAQECPLFPFFFLLSWHGQRVGKLSFFRQFGFDDVTPSRYSPDEERPSPLPSLFFLSPSEEVAASLPSPPAQDAPRSSAIPFLFSPVGGWNTAPPFSFRFPEADRRLFFTEHQVRGDREYSAPVAEVHIPSFPPFFFQK